MRTKLACLSLRKMSSPERQTLPHLSRLYLQCCRRKQKSDTTAYQKNGICRREKYHYNLYTYLFYIENDAEIFPVHYTWKVVEKGFKKAFMML